MSGETKHTAGKWKISEWSTGDGHMGGSIGAEDKRNGSFSMDANDKPVLKYRSLTILNYTITGNGIPEEENRANAALIARAPDLLAENDALRASNAELRAALELFANLSTARQANGDCERARLDLLATCPEYIGYCEQARAALARTK